MGPLKASAVLTDLAKRGGVDRGLWFNGKATHAIGFAGSTRREPFETKRLSGLPP